MKVQIPQKLKDIALNVLCSPEKFALASLIFNLLYIVKFWYNEIDWTSYMAQVSLFRAGERDYTKLVGPQGPANYPAGFIYVYWVLQIFTGEDHLIVQLIFCFVYALLQYIAMKIFEMIFKKEDLWKLALFSIN